MPGRIPDRPRLQSCRTQGRSSVGRAAVSKTVGRGFESLRPCLCGFADALPPVKRRRRSSARPRQGGHMNRPRFRFVLPLVTLLLLAPAALTASAPSTWRRLPAAPITPDFGASTSVWTGTEMLAFGRDVITAKDANGAPYIVK